VEDEPALRLDRATHEDLLGGKSRGDRERLAVGHLAEGERAGPVQHEAARALGSVLEHEDHRALEVRIAELGHGDEESRSERLHGGDLTNPGGPLRVW